MWIAIELNLDLDEDDEGACVFIAHGDSVGSVRNQVVQDYIDRGIETDPTWLQRISDGLTDHTSKIVDRDDLVVYADDDEMWELQLIRLYRAQ